MDMKTFAEFWKGMFFFVSTISMSVLLYLVVVIWQPLWTAGFQDFGEISKSITRLDRTAKPVAEMAPLMLGEMDEIRNSMEKIQLSMVTIEEMSPDIKEMNQTMGRMTWVMEHRMGVMNSEMNRIGDKFSPTGMMPFNW